MDADLDAELVRIAATTGRSKSWIVNEALRSFVANERQFLAAVEEKLGRKLLRVAADAIEPRPVFDRFAHIGVLRTLPTKGLR